MSPREWSDRVSAVSALDDPTRRALYELVSGRERTSRDDAAEALGLPRSTAAFHLDRLADEGLLDVEFRRPAGRGGPGAGRPAKLYSRSAAETNVSVPSRRYELAAELFAQAISTAATSGEPVRTVLRRVAVDAGRAAGARAASFEDALVDGGFEPREDPAGGIVMGNCPFHQLAQRHTELVCELNYELLRGVTEGVPHCAVRVVSDPGAGRCCVRALETDRETADEPRPDGVTRPGDPLSPS
ncbi:helix-turn-helix transcriptional regulator [Georgenia subflava]|uniref:Helix-turn-helix domain-containing protein n=1 Tax=Georgenia subflava TaxID=1622177 RepID=A0A6N7EHS3_9MICO|nr:helix-turn-helix domain-containing protein [Georgenia subflava]MPV36195.1 helix-turn-helix domain-containing protein [Georgenia subflava]